MSHFRCPTSSLVEESALFEFQPIHGLDESQLFINEEEEEEEEQDSTTTLLLQNATHISQNNSSANITSIIYNTVKKENSNKRCWICFGEESDSEGRWVNPCQCSLVSHEECLLDWIAETQKTTTPLKKVSCPQCSSSYLLSERHNLTLLLMGLVDSLVHTAAPYITVLGLGCSMLITSTTFGVYTILTMFGTKEGERLIGNPAFWTWKTWLGLPSIPVALIASRSSKWADYVLPAAALLLLRIGGSTSSPLKITWPPSPAIMFGLLPWVRLLYNNISTLVQRRLSRALMRHQPIAVNSSRTASRRATATTTFDEMNIIHDIERRDEQDAEVLFGREGRDISVNVTGALLWPTISSIIGSYLSHSKFVRRYFPEPFQRNVLGGCLFIVAKDITNLIYSYEKIRQRRSRRVVNYNDIKRSNKQ